MTQSVHLEQFPDVPADWRDEALAEKWRKVRTVRRVVTGALEIERAQEDDRLVAGGGAGRPSSRMPSLPRALAGVDLAEISITSGIVGLDARRRRRAPSTSTT